MERLPFPLQDLVPASLKVFLLDFWWDLDKLHALDLPEGSFNVEELLPYLDLPFWQYNGKPFQITPRDVLRYPNRYGEHYRRTLSADLRYPIIIFKRTNQPPIILDGVHRLLKTYMLGETEIPVKLFSQEQIPLILHV